MARNSKLQIVKFCNDGPRNRKFFFREKKVAEVKAGVEVTVHIHKTPYDDLTNSIGCHDS